MFTALSILGAMFGGALCLLILGALVMSAMVRKAHVGVLALALIALAGLILLRPRPTVNITGIQKSLLAGKTSVQQAYAPTQASDCDIEDDNATVVTLDADQMTMAFQSPDVFEQAPENSVPRAFQASPNVKVKVVPSVLSTRIDRRLSRVGRLFHRLRARSFFPHIVSALAIAAFLYLAYLFLDAGTRGHFSWALRFVSVVLFAVIYLAVASIS